MDSPIYESFTLPSKGLVYTKPINPVVTLRSMTTLEEMKRLSPSDTPYKLMADIIEDCMKEKPEIHVYDMCLGDYQFLLHKLRVVTYGSDYKMLSKCPNCGETLESTADLNSIDVYYYDETFADAKRITLPISENVIELNYQTPRMLDTIAYKKKDLAKREKAAVDYELLCTIIELIKTVDGVAYDSIKLEDYVKNLPMKDVKAILNAASEINRKVGLNNQISVRCSNCGFEMMSSFRFTSEFFGPSN